MVRNAHERGDRVDEAAPIQPNGSDFQQAWHELVGGGDSAARRLLDKDAVLRIPGRTRIAGTYRGREAITDFFRTLDDAAGGRASHEIIDVVLFAAAGHVSQSVHVIRSGRNLVDTQRVSLQLDRGKIVEILIESLDRVTHEEVWGRAPLFTEEDREILADAIRKGTAPARDQSVERRAIVIGLVLLFLLVSTFYWLATTRYNQRLFASTTNINAVRHVTVGHPETEGRWTIEPALVRGVDVLDPFGQVDVVLPLAESECQSLADALGQTCSAGTISLQPPVHLDWSRPSRLRAVGKDTSRLDLELIPGEEPSDPYQVDLVTFTETAPRLCFTKPLQSTDLQIAFAGRSEARNVPASGAFVTCQDGVVLRVGAARGEILQTTTVLRGASDLDLTARGTTSELDGLAGKLSLVNVSASVFDPAAHIVTRSSSAAPMETSLHLSEAESRLSMRSESVKSVLTDDGELLPTKWALLPQPFAGMAGVLFGALVLPELAKGLPWLRDVIFLRRRRRVQRS